FTFAQTFQLIRRGSANLEGAEAVFTAIPTAVPRLGVPLIVESPNFPLRKGGDRRPCFTLLSFKGHVESVVFTTNKVNAYLAIRPDPDFAVWNPLQLRLGDWSTEYVRACKNDAYPECHQRQAASSICVEMLTSHSWLDLINASGGLFVLAR